MKNHIARILGLLIGGVWLASAAWLTEFHEVKDPPRVFAPPGAWEKATVPPGALFEYYAYEQFADEVDWATGEVIGRKLIWKRASFFIPAQKFGLMQLQPDNTWACVQIVQGPLLYFAMDGRDGDAVVLRLQAL